MQHDTPLITMIVAGLVLAYIFGMIANRLKLPPLVGYLFAGIVAGPYTPGFVADQEMGAQLAELGVILLMFGVGLHFSLKDLMSVRALAIPGALVQIAFATLLGVGLGTMLGWDLGGSLLFGLALSTASTVVLLKAMQDRRLIETERGQIAVGWLIVEDLAMVLALVLIPAFANLSGNPDSVVHDPFVSFVERLLGMDIGIWGVLTLTLVKIAAFIGFMLIVGRRAIPWALHATAHTGSRELFRLAVLAIALGVALGSSILFGVSLALGAFFAGMMLSESELSQRAAQETLPLRDAFAVLFFVSIGMLFDPAILLNQPLQVLATLLIIMVGKTLAAFAIVRLFGRSTGTALTISASLAQIGEFSFILASMGVALAILPKDAQNLIVAGSLISIMLNPLAFFVVDLLRPRLETRSAQRQGEPAQRVEPGETIDAVKGAVVPESAPSDDIEPSRQTDHIVLVGFGRVGSVIGQALTATGSPLVVVEDAEHSIEAARAGGMEVVRGNAASTAVLKLANLAGAKVLLVAISNGFEAGSVVEAGRKLNPGIRILARAHSEEEAAHLRHFGANEVIMGEREIGLGMLAWLRGERGEADAPSPVPAEPKLAPVDNILEKMAATPAAIAVPVVAAVEAIESVVQPAAMVEAAELAAEPGIELPPDPNRVDDPEGVEAERDAVPAEEPATEAVMEAEAAEAESVIVLPPPAPAPDEAVEIAAEDAVAEADEISEGGPVTPPAAPEVDKPTDSDVPAVVPEPKI